MLTAERLRELLDYDPETGAFTWKVAHPCNHILVGDRAGYERSDGRWAIKVDQTRYLAHRLAWLHASGEWPPNGIDHTNRDPLDNRLANLRLATQALNSRNKSLAKNSTNGVKGVTWYKKLNKWYCSISCGGKRIHIGYYDLIQDAADAYDAAALRLHGEFACTNAGMDAA